MHGICLVTKPINITKVDMTLETSIYNAQTIATFNDNIDQICCDKVYTCRDPQESYSIFFNEILLPYNNYISLAKKISRQENINHGLLLDLEIPLEKTQIVDVLHEKTDQRPPQIYLTKQNSSVLTA